MQRELDVFEYISTLSEASINVLYQDPATCQAIFRALSPIAQQYVLRFLCLDKPIQMKIFDHWIKTDLSSKGAHKAALQKMQALRVLVEEQIGGHSLVKLNSAYQKQLRHVLAFGPLKPRKELPIDTNAPTVEFVNAYARNTWESVLHFMAQSTAPGVREPSDSVINLLIQARLIQHDEERMFKMTPSGFQFLLRPTNFQVWKLMLEYVDTAPSRNMEPTEVLTFVFHLSFLSAGTGYAVDGLTGTQRTLLGDLRNLGLVWQKTPQSTRFYPTKLATDLSAGSNLHEAAEGFLIVESNFKVYAYTDSELKIALLSSFVKLEYRLPNLVVGTLTRESIRQALINGITANQINEFLLKHAHEQVRKSKSAPPVPENILEQLILWEGERNRVQADVGYLYEEFHSQDAFDKTAQYAKDTNVLVWAQPERRLLFIRAEGHESIRTFVRRITIA
eukprot:GILJ01011218.1.p1 GENE.GILJ01011218.1~~GILJ01011218.1.p1  ORF type:complete len:449 (+),score=53.58 GILJ01011218.1:37-1383(+)